MLVVGVAVSVELVIEPPALAEVVVERDDVEEARNVIDREGPEIRVVGAVGIVLVAVVKIVVAVVEELAARRIVVVECIDDDVCADHTQVGAVAELVGKLRGDGHVLLGREGLVSV